MSTAWFYNHRGRLQGPFEAEIIIKKITASELGPDDLVYQEGEDKWKPISSIPQFSKSLPKLNKEEAEKMKAERPWVVLERNKDKANRQLGPYSTDEIRGMLIREELRLSDYVWRPGMKEWYRIQVFTEFIDEVEKESQPPNVPEPPAELPANSEVYEIKYEEVTANVPMPEEAEGPDLAETQYDPRDEESMETRVNYRLGPDAMKGIRKSVDSGSAAIEFLRNLISNLSAKWVGTALGVLAALFVAKALWGLAVKKMNEKPEKTQQVAAKVRPTPVPVVKTKAVAPVQKAVPEKPKPTVEPKRPASYVKLKHDPKSSKLTVQTDASSHFATTFEFTSVFAKILGSNSYHRVLLRKDRTLKLRDLNWPRGYYKVEARMGDFSSKATVFVGTGKSYTKELRKFKKRMTYEFMNERVAYIKTAKRLLDKVRVFETILGAAKKQAAWRRDYGPWRRSYKKINHPTLRKIGPKSRSRYVMAEMWLELKSLRKDIDKFTRSMATKSKRLASTSPYELRKLRRQLQDLEGRAQGLSLWR